MEDSEKCFLCLETKVQSDMFAQLSSKDGEYLKIKEIALQHFHSILDEKDLQIICQECWQETSNFHQFYLRIKKAHENFQQIKILGTTNAITEEKEELESVDNNDFEVQMLSEELDDVPQYLIGSELNHKSINFDSLNLESGIQSEEKSLQAVRRTTRNCKKGKSNNLSYVVKKEKFTIEKRRRGRPTKNKINSVESEKQQEKTKDITIKVEVKSSVCNNSNTINDDIFAENSPHSKSSDNQNKSKVKYVVRKNLSLEYDKFIAENFKLSCFLCQKILKNFTELYTHFRNEHKTPGYAMCCGKKFLKRGVLVDHIHTHIDPNYFKCLKCDKILADRRCLELHEQVHDDKNDPPAHKCEVCSKSFHKKVVYLRHMQIHIPDELKEFTCPQCPKKFSSNYFMNQHFKIVHLNVYSKMCEVCGKKITGRDALKRHQELHDNVRRAYIQCETCGMSLVDKYGLARHIKVMHTKEFQVPQKCPYPSCSKICPNLTSQKRHFNYMHKMQRTHACPMCEKSFKIEKTLKEHMSMHTGDILYKCSFCQKTFNSNANMYSHRKRAHPKEWELYRQMKYSVEAEENPKEEND